MERPTESPIHSGAYLDGWLLDWPLGEGRSGIVFRCHRAEDPNVLGALKAASRDDGRDAIRRERAALERVAHPAFPAVLGHGERAGQPWFVMELVEGRSVASMAGRPLPAAGVVDVLAQLADAIAALHREGLVHGDLKPAHVVVDPVGRGRILDLGAATDLSDIKAAGTAAYAPPEWHSGDVRDERAADVYALGIIAWEMLRGRPAFHGPDPMPRVALDPGEGAPDALREAILAATSPDPVDRPTAAALRDRIAGLDGGGAVAMASGTWIGGPPDPPATPTHGPGDRIGRYELRDVVGAGGMGVVHRAWDTELRREVALKLTLPGRTDAERARREARALAQVTHPGIVQVLDMGASPSGVWFAMELVDGPDLGEHIAEHGALDALEAATWARDLGRALAHAHARGVVHRDVKPTNVLLDRGRPRLVDFGLAAVDSASVGPLTAAGAMLGTPAYMAPEQASGEEITSLVDVYALGAVLFHMVTGRKPFDGDHPAAVVHQVLHTHPAMVHQLRPELPEALSWIVAKAMAKDPGDRYASADALADELDAWLAGAAIIAGPETRLDAARRWIAANRRRLAWGAGIVVGVGAVVALAVGGWNAYADWQQDLREQAAQERLDAVRMQASTTEPDEVDALYDAFLDVDSYRDTPARIQAWIDRGNHLAVVGRPDASTAAFARAYEESAAAGSARDALLALARSFAGQGRWDERNAVAAAITRRVPDWQDDDELARTVRGARASARLPALPIADDPATRPIQDRLLRGTPLGPDVLHQHAATGDIDGDGRDELVVDGPDAARRIDLDDGRVSSVRLDGTVGTNRSMQVLSIDGRTYLKASAPEQGRHHSLFTVEGDVASQVADLGVYTRVIVPADLDRDGLDELYVGTLGSLGVARPDGRGGWSQREPAYGESRRSQVSAVVIDDLNDDGAAEVVSFHGAWSAFDARLGLPGGGNALTLTARHKIGQIFHAQAMTLADEAAPRRVVAAFKARSYASRQAFPVGDPYGPPPGVYLLGWRGDGIEVVNHLEARPTCAHGFVADLDGDGLDDIVASCAKESLLWRQRPDGGFDAAEVLQGVNLAQAFDADGDGLTDVFAYDEVSERAWILGAGDTRLPARDEWLPPTALPDDVPASQRPAWERAEDLVSAALYTEAASAFERLAALASPGLAAEAELRAAQVLAGSTRDPERATRLFERAAETDRTRSRALHGWATLARDIDPEQAVDVVRQLLQEPDLPADIDATWVAALPELEALAQREVTALIDSGTLAMEVMDPHGVRVQRDGVMVEGVDNRQPLLVAPVTWNGGAVRLEVDFELERLEWAGAVTVAVLDDDDTPLVRFLATSYGGGEAPYLITDPPGAHIEAQIHGASDRVRITAVVDANAPDEFGRVWRRIGDDEPYIARTNVRRKVAPKPGPAEVVIKVGSTQAGGSLVRAIVHELRVTGVSPRRSTPAPEARAHRELANFNPQAALNLLPPNAQAWSWAVALEDLGRHQEAVEVVMGAGADATTLDKWASLRPTLIRRVDPDGWLARLGRSRAIALYQHPDDAGTADLVLSHAELPLALPRDPDDAEMVVFVVLARGKVLRDEGRLGEAQTHLRWVLDQIDEGQVAGTFRTRALVQLALLAADLGDRDAAMQRVLEALDGARYPELTADLLDLTVELEDFHDHPAWAEVRRARRLR